MASYDKACPLVLGRFFLVNLYAVSSGVNDKNPILLVNLDPGRLKALVDAS